MAGALTQLPASLRQPFTLKAYWEVTKPKIWYLLAFTSIIASVVAARGKGLALEPFLLANIAVVLGSAGSNTVTSYIDRDIDAIMNRTKRRPIPTGLIKPSMALAYGLILISLSLLFSSLVSPLVGAFMALGIFDNVIVYSLWLKRRSPWNIILGGLSGGFPTLIGYSAISNQISLEPVMMAGLVFIWIPVHIWSLALRFKEDYEKAKVPMLPVVKSEEFSVRIIAFSTVAMVTFSLLLYLLGIFGRFYLYSAGILGSLILAVSSWLIWKPGKEKAWLLFKFSSPYLALIFVAMAVDAQLSPFNG